MTRRDYVLIAKVLKGLCQDKAHCFDDEADQLAIATRFADAIAEENPNFDRSRFIDASIEEVECVNPNAGADNEVCLCKKHRANTTNHA